MTNREENTELLDQTFQFCCLLRICVSSFTTFLLMVPSGPVMCIDGFMSQTGAFPPVVGFSELESKVSTCPVQWR